MKSIQSVIEGLLVLGYDASICKSRWEKSPSYPSGEYEYIDVIIEGERLLWQLFPDGTDYMDDGYAVVLSHSPSTSNLISLQSTRLMLFNSLCSWRTRWGCKKKKALEEFLYHDEL